LHRLNLEGLLRELQKRFGQDPRRRGPERVVPYVLPAPIADLDTRFFRSDQNGRTQGGLFGLDAIHPTVSGYGIMAQALLDVITAGDPEPTPELDFAALRAKDTLNTSPPALLNSVLSLLEPFLTVMLTRR
jgi:hypothetical protein